MNDEISVPEAANLLGLSRQRIYKMVETGKLRGRRQEIAGRVIVLVDAESVHERLAERSAKELVLSATLGTIQEAADDS